jgi:hypothetical protein
MNQAEKKLETIVRTFKRKLDFELFLKNAGLEKFHLSRSDRTTGLRWNESPLTKGSYLYCLLRYIYGGKCGKATYPESKEYVKLFEAALGNVDIVTVAEKDIDNIIQDVNDEDEDDDDDDEYVESKVELDQSKDFDDVYEEPETQDTSADIQDIKTRLTKAQRLVLNVIDAKDATRRDHELFFAELQPTLDISKLTDKNLMLEVDRVKTTQDPEAILAYAKSISIQDPNTQKGKLSKEIRQALAARRKEQENRLSIAQSEFRTLLVSLAEEAEDHRNSKEKREVISSCLDGFIRNNGLKTSGVPIDEAAQAISQARDTIQNKKHVSDAIIALAIGPRSVNEKYMSALEDKQDHADPTTRKTVRKLIKHLKWLNNSPEFVKDVLRDGNKALTPYTTNQLEEYNLWLSNM